MGVVKNRQNKKELINYDKNVVLKIQNVSKVKTISISYGLLNKTSVHVHAHGHTCVHT